MHTKNYLIAAATLVCLFSAKVSAQTVSTFDDLSLPGNDTNFANTQAVGDYIFRSGNVLFHGELASWGGYIGFNYSNMTNDTTQNYTNDKSAITGTGADNSANYGVCYVPLDYLGANPNTTLPVGVRLKDSAAGHPVKGAYITNTTYAYWYMVNNFHSGNWFKLTVRGFLNGQKVADSVNFMLGSKTDSTTNMVNQWTWVNLTSLGNVDSLTFDLSSNDTAGGFGMNNPSYFAIDNLTTLDADTATNHTGIDAVNSADFSLSISPNPVRDVLFIHSPKPLQAAVFDLAGKEIIYRQHTQSIKVESLTSGIYILKVWDGENSRSFKFIKE